MKTKRIQIIDELNKKVAECEFRSEKFSAGEVLNNIIETMNWRPVITTTDLTPPPAADEGFRFEVGQRVLISSTHDEHYVGGRLRDEIGNIYALSKNLPVMNTSCYIWREKELEPIADDHDPANQATS